MSIKIATIVEGHGEVAAFPILLRRLCDWRAPGLYVDVSPPIRVKRDRFLNRDEEFRRHLLLAAGKAGEGGWVVILLDADDDCPATLGAAVRRRAEAIVRNAMVSVVFANREYEAWFIAAARSLDGVRGFSFKESSAVPAEQPRDAKRWIGERMISGYGEVLDQPAFSARLDLKEAHDGSRSFRKLCSEWERINAARSLE